MKSELCIKQIIKFNNIKNSNLYFDCIYEGGTSGNLSDEVISKLMSCENSGGFRKVGKSKSKINYVVLYSTKNNKEEWFDLVDYDRRLVKYHGDNKRINVDIHDTRKKGNLILKKTFDNLVLGNRKEIPPFLCLPKKKKEMLNLGGF